MTEEYKKWIEWEQKNSKGPPMTRTQADFAEYILGNEELMNLLTHPGDLLSIMQRVQQYLKS